MSQYTTEKDPQSGMQTDRAQPLSSEMGNQTSLYDLGRDLESKMLGEAAQICCNQSSQIIARCDIYMQSSLPERRTVNENKTDKRGRLEQIFVQLCW